MRHELAGIEDMGPRPPKTCVVCLGRFVPFQPLQRVCNLQCARRVPIMARNAAKADRKATRARLDEMKPLSHWVKQAQQAFNAWVRERDRLLPCISCGKTEANAWNGQNFEAGHYLSTAAKPELRFDPDNVHRQCVKCNHNLSGNAVNFRIGLIQRVGQLVVDRLEGPHEPKRYRAEELKAITADYRARLKALQKAAA